MLTAEISLCQLTFTVVVYVQISDHIFNQSFMFHMNSQYLMILIKQLEDTPITTITMYSTLNQTLRYVLLILE